MKRFTSLMAVAVVSAGLLLTAATSASAAVAPSKATSARNALQKYLKHNHPLFMRAKRISNITDYDSYNWSGYADTSSTDGTFTSVSGSWTQPKVTCTKEDQLASTWVGLDGFSDTTVEQDGTLAWCFEDTAYYYTWYEMYPAGTIEEGSTLLPGDKITASVKASAGSYTLAVTDATTPANSFSTTQSCSTSTCLDTSAEWIAERPAFSIGVAPLADYKTWKVTGAKVDGTSGSGTISDTNYDPADLAMIDATSNYYLSVPSALNSKGNSFSTTWYNSY